MVKQTSQHFTVAGGEGNSLDSDINVFFKMFVVNIIYTFVYVFDNLLCL
jgi:hypothetical protein